MAGGFSLTLAFPDQSPSFAHGFDCGRIWQRMTDNPALDINVTVVAETRTMIEAMAMSKGWTEIIEEAGDGWLHVTLRSPVPQTADATASYIEPTREQKLESALEAAVATIRDYLAYEHDGDPGKEDARTMGEMDINDYATDGRLDYAMTLLRKTP